MTNFLHMSSVQLTPSTKDMIWTNLGAKISALKFFRSFCIPSLLPASCSPHTLASTAEPAELHGRDLPMCEMARNYHIGHRALTGPLRAGQCTLRGSGTVVWSLPTHATPGTFLELQLHDLVDIMPLNDMFCTSLIGSAVHSDLRPPSRAPPQS